MMSPNESGPAEQTGDGWAKTVVDGIVEGESDRPDSPEDAQVIDVDPDAEVIDAEIVGDEVEIGGADPDVEVVDAEVIDADVVDAEVLDGDAASGDRQPAGTAAPVSVEALVADLERVSAERDRYLDTSRRIQAEFENYKKQVAKREVEARDRANDSLIGELLPVLDAFDGALAAGADDVAPMRSTFLDTLARQGLERIEPAEGQFDPNLHEAVIHEDDAGTDGPVVAEVMRAGYLWKGRVLRPAMVRTRG